MWTVELLNYRIRCDEGRSAKIKLIPLGDVHYGTKHFDREKFTDTCNWLTKDQNAYVLCMGDMAEFISHTDKRFDPQNIDQSLLNNLDNLAETQANYIIKHLRPFSHRIIGMLTGNHEDTIRHHHQFDIQHYMCKELNAPNLSYTAIIRLQFFRNGSPTANREVLIYASHGFGGSVSETSAIGRLITMTKDFDADIYLMGHVHKKVAYTKQRLHLVGRGSELSLVPKKRIYGLTGTFLRTYTPNTGSSSYAEKRGYSPTATGTLRIEIEPFRHTTVQGKWVELPAHLHISE